MKVLIIRKPILVLSSFLMSALLVGCFGGGIDPKDDPVQPSGNNAAANAEEDVAENDAGLNENAAANEEGANNAGNGGNNNLGAGNNNFNQGGDNGKDGEAINNAADDDFLNGNNANANIGGAANGQANMFGNNPNTGLNNNNNNLGKNNNNGLGNNNFGLNAGDNDGALVNGAGNDILESPDVNKGATDNGLVETGDVLAPVAENPTAPAAGGAPGNGVVRYVSPGGSKLYDKPNGETLRSLEQGDHPLVNEEGEWSRTSDGYYVPAASLTAAPVPRLKQPKEWR